MAELAGLNSSPTQPGLTPSQVRAQQSVNTLLAERAKTHGDFSDHAKITQRLKRVMSDTRPDGWLRLSAEQCEALEMIAHKIGRILAGDPNVKDHWDDIAGYATLVAGKLK